MLKKLFIPIFVLFFLSAGKTFAQNYSSFKAPTIKKVSHANRKKFKKRFANYKWTGQGLYKKTTIDHVPTAELRARLQKVFGNPTQKVGDLIHKHNFRPAEYIEFEYWFVVNDSIPMMVLDVDGPFSKGLTYVGASRYIDLMPGIKRTFSKKLMSVKKLAPYSDYFYSPERKKWYLVKYKNGKFSHKRIKQPKGMVPHSIYVNNN
ncbi:MAG TPA: hypothetical protein VKA34_07815 [Balneolales bacterium]|nr:hypothetical protein [Balneolales bacterium]